MRQITLAGYIAGIGLLIAVLHLAAIHFFLYWDIWWFDIVMHFLGGFWVALLGLWVLDFFVARESLTPAKILLASLLFAFVVGVLWEVFEFQAGLSFVGTDAWGDTILDLVMDLVGAVVAAVYVTRRFLRTADTKKHLG